jgi:hypothetical protein
MKGRPLQLALALALAVLFAIPLAAVAFAQGPLVDTALTWLPTSGAFQLDQDATVAVRLTTGNGTPLANQTLAFVVPGGQQRTMQTDENGVVNLTFHISVGEGSHTVGVSFRGDGIYRPANLLQQITVLGSSGTRLVIEPLGSIPAGKNAYVTVQLMDEHGIPIAGERVQLSVDGQKSENGQTDANGEVQLRVGQDISTGVHRIAATYDGSRQYGTASATLNLGVNALQVEIHTMPAFEGVRFALDGRIFSTDKDGIARIAVDRPGTYQVQALPFQTDRTDIQAVFGGWADQTFTPYHEVTVPSDAPLEAGYNVSYKISQSFVDLDGNAVDPKRVTSMTFKRSDGKVYTFDNADPRWLESNYLVRRIIGLVESSFQYSLTSLIVNGTNVISEQQQRFYVRPDEQWKLQLLLFSANFRAHDTLFGFPLGSGIEIRYPDGFQQHLDLGADGQVTIRSLPRGNYQVAAKTTWGLAPVSSLAMSRNQQVDLPIVSYLDIFAIVLLGLLLGPGLLYAGQPKFRRAIHDGTIWPWVRKPRLTAEQN